MSHTLPLILNRTLSNPGKGSMILINIISLLLLTLRFATPHTLPIIFVITKKFWKFQ